MMKAGESTFVQKSAAHCEVYLGSRLHACTFNWAAVPCPAAQTPDTTTGTWKPCSSARDNPPLSGEQADDLNMVCTSMYTCVRQTEPSLQPLLSIFRTLHQASQIVFPWVSQVTDSAIPCLRQALGEDVHNESEPPAHPPNTKMKDRMWNMDLSSTLCSVRLKQNQVNSPVHSLADWWLSGLRNNESGVPYVDHQPSSPSILTQNTTVACLCRQQRWVRYKHEHREVCTYWEPLLGMCIAKPLNVVEDQPGQGDDH